MKRVKAKKGFTMIEIIIVLVILAILIGASVPSMIGFVGEARAKAHLAEARTGYQAAQAVWSEGVALGETDFYGQTATKYEFTDGAKFKGLTKFSAMLAGDYPVDDYAFDFDDTTGIATVYYAPGQGASANNGVLIILNSGGTSEVYSKASDWTAEAKLAFGITPP